MKKVYLGKKKFKIKPGWEFDSQRVWVLTWQRNGSWHRQTFTEEKLFDAQTCLNTNYKLTPLPCDVIHCMTAKRSLNTMQSKISSNSSLDSIRHHSVILQYSAHKIVIKSCKTSQLHRSILRVARCNKNKSFSLNICSAWKIYSSLRSSPTHLSSTSLSLPVESKAFLWSWVFSRKWTVSKF